MSSVAVTVEVVATENKVMNIEASFWKKTVKELKQMCEEKDLMFNKSAKKEDLQRLVLGLSKTDILPIPEKVVKEKKVKVVKEKKVDENEDKTSEKYLKKQKLPALKIMASDFGLTISKKKKDDIIKMLVAHFQNEKKEMETPVQFKKEDEEEVKTETEAEVEEEKEVILETKVETKVETKKEEVETKKEVVIEKEEVVVKNKKYTELELNQLPKIDLVRIIDSISKETKNTTRLKKSKLVDMIMEIQEKGK